MTNNEPREDNFKERILKNIETEDIKVYSKTHFILRVILLIAVAMVTLIISVFLFNYVFFSLRISSHDLLLRFGPQGIVPFLEFFPWPFLFIDIALIVILEWLLRKFRFGYRSPILYLLFGLLIITVSAGYFIDRETGFNDVLLRQADHDYLPSPFGELYESARGVSLTKQGICRCTITAINGRVLVAQDVDTDDINPTAITIVIPASYTGTNSLSVGDTIFVAGAVGPSGTIQAFDIAPIAHSASTSNVNF
jgi:hypothetical protein